MPSQNLIRFFWLHRTLMVVTGLYYAGATLYYFYIRHLGLLENDQDFFIQPVFIESIFLSLIGLPVLWAVHRLFHQGRKAKNPLNKEILGGAVVAFPFIYAVLMIFGPVKSAILHVMPYRLDTVFAAIDKTLHFGKYPHEWLFQILPQADYIFITDALYTVWFLVIYIALWAALLQKPHSFARQHFIIAFCLIWIVIGNLLATLMASVGPIFYDVFEPLSIASYSQALARMQSLNAHTPLTVMTFYDWLVDLSHDAAVFDPNGPSAMPSVHVAMSTLIALYTRRYASGLLFACALSYLIFTVFGSVYLLWHYAFDSYCAVIFTFGLWKGSEMLLKKTQPELTHDRRAQH